MCVVPQWLSLSCELPSRFWTRPSSANAHKTRSIMWCPKFWVWFLNLNWVGSWVPRKCKQFYCLHLWHCLCGTKMSEFKLWVDFSESSGELPSKLMKLQRGNFNKTVKLLCSGSSEMLQMLSTFLIYFIVKKKFSKSTLKEINVSLAKRSKSSFCIGLAMDHKRNKPFMVSIFCCCSLKSWVHLGLFTQDAHT